MTGHCDDYSDYERYGNCFGNANCMSDITLTRGGCVRLCHDDARCTAYAYGKPSWRNGPETCVLYHGCTEDPNTTMYGLQFYMMRSSGESTIPTQSAFNVSNSTLAPSVAPTTTKIVGKVLIHCKVGNIVPTNNPTVGPTVNPTANPTFSSPSVAPSQSPSEQPTVAPTLAPTNPTVQPTTSPSTTPTTSFPSSTPTTSIPSTTPTSNPTAVEVLEVSKSKDDIFIILLCVGIATLVVCIGCLIYFNPVFCGNPDCDEKRDPEMGNTVNEVQTNDALDEMWTKRSAD